MKKKFILSDFLLMGVVHVGVGASLTFGALSLDKEAGFSKKINKVKRYPLESAATMLLGMAVLEGSRRFLKREEKDYQYYRDVLLPQVVVDLNREKENERNGIKPLTVISVTTVPSQSPKSTPTRTMI
jgi:hypothetical protein